MDNFELDASKVEIVYNNDYFKLSKKMQQFVGIWPYETGFKSAIRRYVIFTNLFVTMLPFVNGFRVWCGKNIDLCCENSIAIIYLSIVCLKYTVTLISKKKLKNVYQRVAMNWLTITDPEEKQILIKYARMGKMKATVYIMYMILAGVAFSQVPLVPVILDFIIPLNESREKILFMKGEYVIDPFEHYYKLYIYFLLTSIITISAFNSVDITYTIVAHQNLGIFSIVKHRLKIATHPFDKNSKSNYDKIVEAITLHKEALQFIKLIETSYSLLFLVIIVSSVIFTSLGAVVGMSSINNKILSDVARLILVMLGAAIHLLYLSWPGQMLIDHSHDVFVSIYTNQWYNVSDKGKKLLMFLMLRCLKPCMFTAGGFYIMNFENFGSIVKTAVTYITVAISFRT